MTVKKIVLFNKPKLKDCLKFTIVTNKPTAKPPKVENIRFSMKSLLVEQNSCGRNTFRYKNWIPSRKPVKRTSQRNPIGGGLSAPKRNIIIQPKKMKTHLYI
jgi:hypothetical protein